MSIAVWKLILTAAFEAAKLIIDAIGGDDEAHKRAQNILPERARADLARARYRELAKSRLSE